MIESRKQVKGSLYGATVKELQEQAIEHLAQWNPKQHRALMKRKELRPVTLKAAERAKAEIEELIAAGYQRHEAAEVVLPRYILIKPEQDLIEAIEADEI